MKHSNFEEEMQEIFELLEECNLFDKKISKRKIMNMLNITQYKLSKFVKNWYTYWLQLDQ